MCSKVVVSQIKRLFAYVLPFIVIVSQFIELGAIKMSWLLYLILILYAFFKLGQVLNNYLLIMLSATVCILPLLTSFWNVTGAFNSSLYISLITGLSILLYINEITQSEVQYFLRGCFAACLIFSIWGTFEVISGKYFLFENEDFIFRLNAYGRHYPGTAFTNTNDLAQYLAILLPLTSMIFWNKKFLTLHNILIILTNTLTFFVIFNSASYLGMISFVGTWMIFICGYFFKQKSSLIFLFLTFGIVACGAAYVEYSTGIIGEFIKQSISIDTSAGYFTGRVAIYSSLIEIALKHPFGGFGNAYGMTGAPHNLFLFIMCDFGIITAVLFALGLLFLAIKLLYNLKRKDKRNLYLAILSTLCLFPLTSSISSGNEQRKIIWIFLGICIRIAYLSKKNVEEGIRSK